MSKFYGNMAYITCNNGCNASLQRVLLDANGEPYDMDWDALIAIYSEHNSNCTSTTPYSNDPNAYHGDPNNCGGYKVTNDPSSGYNYCEY